ncbi:MAG: phenylacetate-CoA oxygenase subunit PaaJ [Actinobacteria bacterium]|nr:phenylacetate-CoA oxygenase subunit PaaJ [Actinomycetota bacterium]MBI3687282.1 phenylacetate-CoA oxygenase subunit PaaJ [Actinomycetota bacterium]
MVTAEEVRELVAAVPDPEIPVLTIGDLGVLRTVDVGDSGRVEVTITPTYTGCPAMEAIRADIETSLRRHGIDDVSVRTVLAPAWTTDWMSESGRRKLAEFGIAPPAHPARPALGPAPGPAQGPGPGRVPVPVELAVRCPRCGSFDTLVVSRWGSTACKAQYRCTACLEPFDYFRVH